jgi:Calcineurin-like phosphoesterase
VQASPHAGSRSQAAPGASGEFLVAGEAPSDAAASVRAVKRSIMGLMSLAAGRKSRDSDSHLLLSVLALLAFAPSLGGASVINEAGSGHASPALADAESGLVRATVLNPAGQSRTFRVRRARSAVRLLRYVADVNRDGKITRYDARRFTVARRLLHAADSVHPGSRNRLTEREILRYARRQAGRDRRFSPRELDRMLNRLRVRRPGPSSRPPLLPLPPVPPSSPEPTPTPAADPVIAAAGDIAGSGTGDEATARLLDSLAPTAVLTTGDNAYDNGTLAEFNSFYDPTWGRHRAITHPVPGNHEYRTAGAAGYFDYFGAAASDRATGYYSYNIGAWHLIALNSEIAHDVASVQVAWLKSDLATSTAKCTLAYWHKPRFTAGNYSDFTEYTPFWQALWDANADVVLAGHDHNYQRYTPLNPSGIADAARGLREFVVGTGGRSHYALQADNRRVAGNATAFGVLKLTLHPTSFDFSFVPESGQTYSDSGSAIPCH